MSPADKLIAAFTLATKLRPKAGGFPVFAEVLRRSGIKFNQWHLPSCSSTYRTSFGHLVQQMPPLVIDLELIPEFNRERLIEAIRADQAGLTEFPQFLQDIWKAGVVSYDVDFEQRRCIYYGFNKDVDFYEEIYTAVELSAGQLE